MVDPNRKINRLTEEDIAFLDECEELFANRFAESDDEFKLHCEKFLSEPPVVLNFFGDRGGGTGGQRQNSPYGGRYNDNRHNYRGGRGGYRGYRDQGRRIQPYSRRGGGVGGDGGDGRYRQNYRNYNNERNDDRAMNVRREYGKFVAASNSEYSPSYKRSRDGDADNG